MTCSPKWLPGGEDYNDIRDDIADLTSQISQAVNVSFDPHLMTYSLTNRSAELITELNTTLQQDPSRESEHGQAESIRAWCRSREAAVALGELTRLRYLSGVNLVYMRDRNEAVINSIRLYDPDITLPFDSIGLSGDATSLGWDVSVPLLQDPHDPNLWRATVDLVDGEVKLRADDNWSTNWGAPNLSGESLSFSFVGNAAEVFPEGAAEFQGLNIPVTAGRYEVTFDSQSFEYSFQRVTGGE